MTAASVFSAHGAAIPAVGFGTSPMTGGMSAGIVAAALAAGYRHIDTARKYGTERAVGEAMRASGLPRSDIFLTTKVSHENLRPADFARSLDDSLAALGIDYVDLLLVHWPNPEIPVAEVMPSLAKARRDGLARHIGVANFNIALLDRAIALCPEPLAALQAEYHPYLDQTKLLATVRARPRLHRLLSARARAPVRRPGPCRHRRRARTQRGAGRAALALAARHRLDPVLVAAAAHPRQLRRFRFHAVRRRDAPHFRVEAAGRPRRRSGRPRARRLGLIAPRPPRAADRPIEPCPDILKGTAGFRLVTDDNMGSE